MGGVVITDAETMLYSLQDVSCKFRIRVLTMLQDEGVIGPWFGGLDEIQESLELY